MRSWTRKMWQEWMARKTGIHVRQVIRDDVFAWTLDFDLSIEDIEQKPAFKFIKKHHRHNKPPVGWLFGAGIYNGDELIGVVTVGRPVSPALQSQGCIEITRVCVAAEPNALAWNACSYAYGWACREIVKRGYPQRRVITYTLLDEPGTSLAAAGFKRTFKTKGGSWHRKGRPREDKCTTAPKWRWEKLLDAPGQRKATARGPALPTGFVPGRGPAGVGPVPLDC